MTSTEVSVRAYTAFAGVTGETRFSSKTPAEIRGELEDWIDVFRTSAMEDGHPTPTLVQVALPPKQYHDLSAALSVFKGFEAVTFSSDRQLIAAGIRRTDRMLIRNFDHEIVVDGI